MSKMPDDDSYTSPYFDTLVRVEKLQLLFRQSSVAVYASFVTAILLLTVLWPVQNHAVLMFWLLLIFITAMIRLGLFVRYRRSAYEGVNVIFWEKPYVVTLLLASLTWGGGAVMIMPQGSPLHQAVIYFFLIGMSGGAVAVYSANRQLTLVTIATLLLPATFWFLLQGTLVSVTMAIGVAIFFIGVARSGKVLSQALHDSFILAHELEKEKRQAQKLANRDLLTGLKTRRVFYEQGKVLLAHCNRSDEQLYMIIMDIDHFKKINDTRGHAAGDATLSKVGRLLKKTTRKSDLCARIGGEEFAFLLLGTDEEGAREMAEKLRSKIEETGIVFGGKKFHITASFGVASGMETFDDLFVCADKALYEAKEAGRNRVVFSKCRENGIE